MSKKRKSQLPLLAFVALLVTGALNRQALFSTDAPRTAPSRTIEAKGMSGTWRPCDREPLAILAEFLKRYDPEKIPWFTATIWQRMSVGDWGYESSSRVVLGPGHCARLELDVSGRQGKSKMLVVSDGKTIAKALLFGDEEPEVIATKLAEKDRPDARQRELNDHGCCGPWVLVQRFFPHLHKWQARRAQDPKEKLIKLSANAMSEVTGLPIPPGLPVRCHLYLDETTYWLTRLEWAQVTPGGEEVLLEMEFREPKLNEPLSDEHCVREFSFPKAVGRKGEKG
jgi:hypothetical protein